MKPNVMAIDERRLRYLSETARKGSLRAAADELDRNASVLSRQISELESGLGMPVIEPHGRGVRLTEAGEMLVAFFRQQSTAKEDLIAKLDEIRGLSRGRVDVVVGEGFVSDLLAEPLSVFWREHPKLTVSLKVAGTNEIMRQVEEDGAHIGLVYNPPKAPRIHSSAAFRHPLCAVMHPKHALARRTVKLAELQAYPVAQMDSAYGVRQLVALAENKEGIRLTPTLTTNSMLILKHFVREGFGITMLPAFAMSREIAAGELVANAIDHPLLAAAQAHVITRAGRRLSGAAVEFLRLLTSVMQTFRPPRPSKESARGRSSRR